MRWKNFNKTGQPLAGFHPNPKGIVVLVHGLNEHCGRYDHVALELNRAGFIVYGMVNFFALFCFVLFCKL